MPHSLFGRMCEGRTGSGDARCGGEEAEDAAVDEDAEVAAVGDTSAKGDAAAGAAACFSLSSEAGSESVGVLAFAGEAAVADEAAATDDDAAAALAAGRVMAGGREAGPLPRSPPERGGEEADCDEAEEERLRDAGVVEGVDAAVAAVGDVAPLAVAAAALEVAAACTLLPLFVRSLFAGDSLPLPLALALLALVLGMAATGCDPSSFLSIAEARRGHERRGRSRRQSSESRRGADERERHSAERETQRTVSRGVASSNSAAQTAPPPREIVTTAMASWSETRSALQRTFVEAIAVSSG